MALAARRNLDAVSKLNRFAAVTALAYPLHTGELGGLALKVVLATGGIALCGLSVMGIWQWCRKRKVRKSRMAVA